MRLCTSGRFVTIMMILLIAAVVVVPVFADDMRQNGRIAFTSNQSGTWQLYTMNPDGSGIVQITNLPANNAESFLPDFSPDGGRIVFCFGVFPFGEPVAKSEIYVVNANGSGLQRLTFDGLFDCAPRWSPDGTRIVFARESPRTHRTVVATMRPDGTHIKNLTSDVWGTFRAAFTPDGKRIVFETQQAGFISVVWIMNKDGSHQRRLTPAPIKAGGPAVSSKNQVVFLNNLNSPTSLTNTLFTMNLDGSHRRQITRPQGVSHDVGPNYSPDGTKIVFASDRMSSNNSLDIFVMNPDGSSLTRVASGLTVGGCPDGNCVSPAWGAIPQVQKPAFPSTSPPGIKVIERE